MRKDLKAYVRFDANGMIVPGSLILARSKPKVGKWVEGPAYVCCNPTTTTTTLIPFPEGECYSVQLTCNTRGSVALFGVYYCNQMPAVLEVSYGSPQTVCCYAYPVLLSGNGSFSSVGNPCTTTTTTTEAPITTTTTTTIP